MTDDKELIRKVHSLDWDCVEADTRYLTHAIHRYSGKFIPQIARQVIEIATEPDDRILDPYCGSGTTLLECSLLGRDSVGCDLNPLATLISRAKTFPIERERLASYVQNLESRLRATIPDQSTLDKYDHSSTSFANPPFKAGTDPRWRDKWYVKWFGDRARHELLVIHHEIMHSRDVACRRIALLAFSDILRRSSKANSSYPNVMFDKNKVEPKSALVPFLKRLNEITSAVTELDKAFLHKPIPEVVWANAECVPFPDSSFDAIVTHPPYVGSIPYAEYGSLSLKWLGFEPNEIDKKLTGGKRQSKDVLDRYFLGFRNMIEESHRVLKDSGIFFMLMGNPVVKGRRVDLTKIAVELASSVGFTLILAHHRSGANRRANLMSEEALLFFRKQ